jgi:hypothetical protein
MGTRLAREAKNAQACQHQGLGAITRRDTTLELFVLIQPWAGCEVDFVRGSSKLADRHIVGQPVDFVALKGVGRFLIIVRP